MPIRVATPDGKIAEFPDGTTEATITGALQQQFGGSKAAPAKPSFLSNIATGAGKLFQEPGEVLTDFLHLPTQASEAAINLATNPSARAKLAATLSQTGHQVADTARGYVQQVRDLSPPQFQGSAPRMATAPAQAMEANVVQRYGVNPSPQRLSAALGGDVGQPNANAVQTAGEEFAQHPLSTLAMAAPVAGKIAEVTGAGAKLAGALSGVPNPVSAVRSVLEAGAPQAIETMRSAALAKVLAQRQATTAAADAAAAGKARDAALRPARDAKAAEMVGQDISISDIPAAKSLVVNLMHRLEPTGAIVTPPTDAQAKVYRDIIDVLKPNSQGQRPSFEAVDTLRREIAEPAYKSDPKGYGAIDKDTRKELVRALNAIQDTYTGGLHAPVQANYTEMLANAKAAKVGAKLDPQLAVSAAKLDSLGPKEAAQEAQSIVDRLAKKGLISEAEYGDFRQLAQKATDAQGKSAFRKKLALGGLGVVGVTEAGRLGLHATGVLP